MNFSFLYIAQNTLSIFTKIYPQINVKLKYLEKPTIIKKIEEIQPILSWFATLLFT